MCAHRTQHLPYSLHSICHKPYTAFATQPTSSLKPKRDLYAAQIWDFPTCRTECTLTGHGGDVKSCDWHPTKAVVASGSKDGLVKVWDAKAGRNIATLHGHRNTVMTTQWNANGNWLLSACRDQSLRVSLPSAHHNIALYPQLWMCCGYTSGPWLLL